MENTVVVEDKEFTKAFNKQTLDENPALMGYDRLPREHRARVTVVMDNGEQLVAESGGDIDDLSVQKNDAQVEVKFREMTEDMLGNKRVTAILDRLWHLEDMEQAAEIPRAFVLV